MDKTNRLLIIKCFNAAYRLAFAENAVHTQSLLSFMVTFFRRYMISKDRQIQLKEELENIKLFLKVYGQCIGEEFDFQIQIPTELYDAYLKVNMFLELMVELLVNSDEKRELPFQINVNGTTKLNKGILHIEILGLTQESADIALSKFGLVNRIEMLEASDLYLNPNDTKAANLIFILEISEEL